METLKEIQTIITLIASLVTGTGIIIAATTKGKNWFLKPAIKKISDVEQKCDKNSLDIKRQELLMMIDYHPDMIREIENLFDEYCRLGGNSYVKLVVEQWRENYAKDIIKDRIGKH